MTGQPPRSASVVRDEAGGAAADEPAGLGEVPAAAGDLFADRLPLAVRYAQLLAAVGVERGLIGPREVPRLWSRHLLNCAILTDELPRGATVLDVGSGAGLPGLVLALRRSDLRVFLLEPMQRRVAFLQEAVTTLGLGESVSVVRGRAEDGAIRRAVGRQDWVVARAVAPLDRLTGWCLPLLADDGRLLALKGERAETEADEAKAAIGRLGGEVTGVRRLVVGGASGEGVDPTWVVEVRRSGSGPAGRSGRRGR